MTTYVGTEAILKIGGSPAVIAGILSWSLDEEADDMPDTGLNDEWETRLSGTKLRKRWSGRIRYKHDTAAAGQSTLTTGALVAGEFFASGEVSSHEKKTGSFVVLRKSLEATEDNGMMIYELEFSGTGELTTGTVA